MRNRINKLLHLGILLGQFIIGPLKALLKQAGFTKLVVLAFDLRERGNANGSWYQGPYEYRGSYRDRGRKGFKQPFAEVLRMPDRIDRHQVIGPTGGNENTEEDKDRLK